MLNEGLFDYQCRMKYTKADKIYDVIGTLINKV